MADDQLPKPEPKEIDEKLAMELRHLTANAVLKGAPSGNEQCDNCVKGRQVRFQARQRP